MCLYPTTMKRPHLDSEYVKLNMHTKKRQLVFGTIPIK